MLLGCNNALPWDAIEYIFSYIRDGITYKSILFLCTQTHNKYIGKKDYFCNHLLTILLQHPEIAYDAVTILLQHPEIAYDELREISGDRLTTWSLVSSNPNITVAIMKKYSGTNFPQFKWEKFFIASKLDFNIETARKEYCHEIAKNNWWTDASKNPNIKLIDIENNPNLPWRWEKLCLNPNITVTFVKKNINGPWSWCELSRTISIKEIETEITSIDYDAIKMAPLPKSGRFDTCVIGWHWYGLCKNPTLTIDFVKKYIPKNIGSYYPDVWSHISGNPGIKMSDIENNPQLPFELYHISVNPNLTEEYLTTFIDANIEYELESEFDWDELSVHPNISIKYIMDHPKFLWNYDDGHVWGNPNINIDFIEKYIMNFGTGPEDDVDTDIHYIEWCELSCNPGIKIILITHGIGILYLVTQILHTIL